MGPEELAAYSERSKGKCTLRLRPTKAEVKMVHKDKLKIISVFIKKVFL